MKAIALLSRGVHAAPSRQALLLALGFWVVLGGTGLASWVQADMTSAASISIPTATTSAPLVSDDYRAHPQLLALVARLGEGALVRGNFTQTRSLANLPMPIRASGVFVFWRGQGLYQEARVPFFNAFTITPSQLISWSETGVGSEVKEQSALVQREINKTLLSFFDADLAVIAQRFTTQWTLWPDGRWQLLLTPKLALLAEQMQAIRLDGRAMIEAIAIEASGDHTQLQFTDQQQVAAPSAAECAKFFVSGAAGASRCDPFE